MSCDKTSAPSFGMRATGEEDDTNRRSLRIDEEVNRRGHILLAGALALGACTREETAGTEAAPAAYFDYSGRDDVLGGGVKMVPVDTPKGRSGSGRSGSGTTPGSRGSCCTGGRE